MYIDFAPLTNIKEWMGELLFDQIQLIIVRVEKSKAKRFVTFTRFR